MNSLKLNSSIATALSKAEEELRGILLEAARHVAQDSKEVILHLEDGMKGVVNGFLGTVTINGEHVGNVIHLLNLLKAIGPHISNPAPVVEHKAEEVVAAVEAPVVHAAEEVHAEVAKVEETAKIIKEGLEHPIS